MHQPADADPPNLQHGHLRFPRGPVRFSPQISGFLLLPGGVAMAYRAAAARGARVLMVVCASVLAVYVAPGMRAQGPQTTATPNAAIAPNYDLAANWTSQKVSKLVFDTAVTPRWLESSDRFWYAYQTREGRRFYFVDPVRKSKAPLFDHAKMAATLT